MARNSKQAIALWKITNDAWKDAGNPSALNQEQAYRLARAMLNDKPQLYERFRDMVPPPAKNSITWLDNNRDLIVNGGKEGWRGGLACMVHDLSHLAHRWLHPELRDHHVKQAQLERWWQRIVFRELGVYR